MVVYDMCIYVVVPQVGFPLFPLNIPSLSLCWFLPALSASKLCILQGSDTGVRLFSSRIHHLEDLIQSPDFGYYL